MAQIAFRKYAEKPERAKPENGEIFADYGVEMTLAIEIIQREINQREHAQTFNHLRKNEIELEFISLKKALIKIKS